LVQIQSPRPLLPLFSSGYTFIPLPRFPQFVAHVAQTSMPELETQPYLLDPLLPVFGNRSVEFSVRHTFRLNRVLTRHKRIFCFTPSVGSESYRLGVNATMLQSPLNQCLGSVGSTRSEIRLVPRLSKAEPERTFLRGERKWPSTTF
jgi:hypothetical protein